MIGDQRAPTEGSETLGERVIIGDQRPPTECSETLGERVIIGDEHQLSAQRHWVNVSL